MKKIFYRGYTGKIDIDFDGNIMFGSLATNNGDLVLFEGETPKELFRCFTETVDDYIELRKELDNE